MDEREQYIQLLRKILNYDYFNCKLSREERISLHKEIHNVIDTDKKFKQGEIPLKAVDLANKLNDYEVIITQYRINDKTEYIEAFHYQNETIIAHEKFKK